MRQSTAKRRCQEPRTVILFHPDYNRRLRLLTGSADPDRCRALAGSLPQQDTAGGELHPALRISVPRLEKSRSGFQSHSRKYCHPVRALTRTWLPLPLRGIVRKNGALCGHHNNFMTDKMEKKILLTDCPDAKGLIAKITNICYKHQLNIIKNDEFVDHEQGRFFMRTELEGRFNDETLLADLDDTLPQGAERRLVKAENKRIVILVTKEAHCLGDILMKRYAGALNLEIAAVIGNYDTLAELTGKFDIPFHTVSHDGVDRAEHERQVRAIIDSYAPDYVVLAKYMRVLTPDFVKAYPRKIINIHHSFLPAFIGARPYLQAFNRGVKIIGATAHFVTDDLDEGPIIEQDVTHVDHTFTADDMAKAGRDVEKSVLSRALGLVLAERVFVHGNKTVVFK